MTTAVLRPVGDKRGQRLDQVTAAARQHPFGRTVLLWLASLLYLLGYGVAKVFGAVWFALVWVAMAVCLGWTEARSTTSSTAGDAG